MTDEERFVSLTSDDEQARRLCALAIAFSNAESPISSQEVHAAHYADLSDDSFRRKFSRDREKLVECGLVIRQVGQDVRDALWQADDSSFADGSSLSSDDALMLDVLCTQLVSDPSFAWHDELRLALAKVDHAFGTLTAARLSPTRQSNETLKTLLSCVEHSRLAALTYVDAKGARTERTVAPYGHFGLRGNVYFVCAQVRDGALDPNNLRTLRADRVERVKQLAKRFEMPEDFCVDDYVVLPFQIGATSCTAQLMTTSATDADMLADLSRRSRLHDGLHEVAVSDVTAAARWAIAAGMRPTSPEELVTEWRQLLDVAAAAKAVPQPEVSRATARPALKGRRGRKGGVAELRELMALVGSLKDEGATLTPAAVAARLGIPQERASLLINLILTACTDTGYQLPLTLAEGDGVTLSRSQGVTGRPVRLTQAETRALLAALDELGFAEDDPLRINVLEAFGSSGLDEQALRARVETALSLDQNETLEACSRSISAGSALSFSYQSTGQDEPRRRHVAPQAVRRANELWYLDAYDFDRRALRTFRIDRMSDVRITSVAAAHGKSSPTAARTERTAEVTIRDRTALDLFEWPRLEVVGEQDGCVVAQLPYYGGMWLPRRLAACVGLVTTPDEELVELVRTVGRQA